MAFSSNLSSFLSLSVLPASIAYPKAVSHTPGFLYRMGLLKSYRKVSFTQVPRFSLANINSASHYIRKGSILSPDYRDGYEQKLKEVREELRKKETPLECFVMIDALQRLAIDYHFSGEIETMLHRMYNVLIGDSGVTCFAGDNNLYNISLCFRILRQNGYHVPADVFERFRNIDGQFYPTLSNDLKGMMSLYEASQLGIEGEDILDQANDFTSKHLNESITVLDRDKSTIVKYILDNPSQKSLARFHVKHYIKNFETEYGRYSTLQELAKMDFNIVQSLHQSELLQVSDWWRDLGLNKKMEFARDQPVKWYMWSLATLTDPILSKQRIEITKPVSLVYLLDDIFDVYGTLDQLVQLTETINKWDVNATEELPYCMKVFLKALDDITNEISYKVFKEYGYNPIESLRQAWKSLCNAFLVEAKWFASGRYPKADEYLNNAVVSSGVHVILIHLFFLLGDGIRKDSVDLVNSNPSIISCPATILRLWDDLGSAKDEKQEGYDGSYIDYYMKDTRSTTESARGYVICMITNEWKRLNKECLFPNLFPSSFIKASLNAAKMVQMMYSYNVTHELPILEEHIKSLLYEKLP